jgi:hypothetical protein
VVMKLKRDKTISSHHFFFKLVSTPHVKKNNYIIYGICLNDNIQSQPSLFPHYMQRENVTKLIEKGCMFLSKSMIGRNNLVFCCCCNRNDIKLVRVNVHQY